MRQRKNEQLSLNDQRRADNKSTKKPTTTKDRRLFGKN